MRIDGADITIRPAHRNDAADLAILDNIAGHGISHWFWQGAVRLGKSRDAYDFGRSRMMDDKAPYAWSNARIAEHDGLTLGSCCSYLMPAPDPDDDKSNPPQFVPVFELFSQATGDWFVDSLAVYEVAQRQGVGKLLMADSLERGRETGVSHVGLVAQDNNSSAMSFYRSLGFEVVDRRPFIAFNPNDDANEWLLLKRSL